VQQQHCHWCCHALRLFLLLLLLLLSLPAMY
jgi:hypothetical protein